jgi:hypothetical protein
MISVCHSRSAGIACLRQLAAGVEFSFDYGQPAYDDGPAETTGTSAREGATALPLEKIFG